MCYWLDITPHNRLWGGIICEASGILHLEHTAVIQDVVAAKVQRSVLDSSQLEGVLARKRHPELTMVSAQQPSFCMLAKGSINTSLQLALLHNGYLIAQASNDTKHESGMSSTTAKGLKAQAKGSTKYCS